MTPVAGPKGVGELKGGIRPVKPPYLLKFFSNKVSEIIGGQVGKSTKKNFYSVNFNKGFFSKFQKCNGSLAGIGDPREP